MYNLWGLLSIILADPFACKELHFFWIRMLRETLVMKCRFTWNSICSPDCHPACCLPASASPMLGLQACTTMLCWEDVSQHCYSLKDLFYFYWCVCGLLCVYVCMFMHVYVWVSLSVSDPLKLSWHGCWELSYNRKCS